MRNKDAEAINPPVAAPTPAAPTLKPSHRPPQPPKQQRPRRASPSGGATLASGPCETGSPWPLGATLQGGGVNFAVYASAADQVEFCVFDETGATELARHTLPACTDHVWHGFIPGLPPGTKYGLRVHGPYDPANGQRHNPNKLLIDPYARALDRPLRNTALGSAYVLGGADEDFTMDTVDNAADAAKGVLVDPAFDWGDDRLPQTPWDKTLFYEVNVRGFTRQLPEVPEPLRGTYAGLATAPAIDHLKKLGVTAVELLPVQAFSDDNRLSDMGLANYWGYNTAAFFAPEPRYASGNDPHEFRHMVKALHAAGIEVILDVVYNHTCEGNHLGPTISLKGIDNAAYYRLTEDRRLYMDYTGTGNTVDASHPAALRLIMDSLRYWVQEMHVDGFRFDLAPAISRDGKGAFDHRAPFLSAVAQDPVLRHVKMIAEPWDIGDNGYQVGGFPAGWSEWNGGYRDAVRDFWRSNDGALPEFASRLCGSPDLFEGSRRTPCASVNLITVHDGFTLQDLVSYNEKHNDANGEESRDGENHNRSWNCGAEGDTDDAGILALRNRQKRNLLTTLFVSRGVPLLLGGDEIGRTQQGNNNAYCQDNALSWFDWSRPGDTAEFESFVQQLVQLRAELAVLRRNEWPTAHEGFEELSWFSVWGKPMTQEEWEDPAARCLGVVLRPPPVGDAPSADATVMLLFNASAEPVSFALPQAAEGVATSSWRVRVDTAHGQIDPLGEQTFGGDDHVELAPHAMAVLVQVASA